MNRHSLRSVSEAAAVLGVLCALLAGGPRAADPVKAGSAYIHTKPEKSRNINPQPFFVDTATVTDNMKEAGDFGTRVDRLHSWAGWMLWGNLILFFGLILGASLVVYTVNLLKSREIGEATGVRVAPA